MQSEKVVKISQDAFQKEVTESKDPVVVDFYADWCPPCKMVSPILENLSSEYADKVKFVKVDVDDNPELASQFGIMSIPTVIFFKKGSAQDAVVGAVSAAVYKRKVDDTLKTSTGAIQ